MPAPTPQATVDLIMRMVEQGINTHQIAGVVGMSNNGVKYIRDRVKAEAYHGPRVTEYDVTNRPIVETPEMAARFAQAMNGQTYQSFKTKTYGRPPRLASSGLVMTQSTAGSCADAA